MRDARTAVLSPVRDEVFPNRIVAAAAEAEQRDLAVGLEWRRKTMQRTSISVVGRKLSVNELPVPNCPTVRDLKRILGVPARVHEGTDGNVQTYDQIGVSIRHDHDQKVSDMTLYLADMTDRFAFAPVSLFSGGFSVDGIAWPIRSTMAEVVRAAPRLSFPEQLHPGSGRYRPAIKGRKLYVNVNPRTGLIQDMSIELCAPARRWEFWKR